MGYLESPVKLTPLSELILIRENVQTPDHTQIVDLSPGPSCGKATVLTTTSMRFPCIEVISG